MTHDLILYPEFWRPQQQFLLATVSSAVPNHTTELKSGQYRTSQNSPNMKPADVISDPHLIYYYT